ncbi:hypothetical protein [Methylobacterium nigriterrae]|uniref:hypothetical protein n=1 Tax=Methylobacterium nigriterrae TaxID=3127512 RepID=UPI0030136F6F
MQDPAEGEFPQGTGRDAGPGAVPVTFPVTGASDGRRLRGEPDEPAAERAHGRALDRFERIGGIREERPLRAREAACQPR